MRKRQLEVNDVHPVELSALGAEKVMRCPQCGRHVKAWWSINGGNDVEFGVYPPIDDEPRYRQWLEQNRPTDPQTK